MADLGSGLLQDKIILIYMPNFGAEVKKMRRNSKRLL